MVLPRGLRFWEETSFKRWNIRVDALTTATDQAKPLARARLTKHCSPFGENVCKPSCI